MNKKVLLLPILGSFLLSGCKFNLFGKPIYLFEKKPDPEINTVEIPDVTPDEMHKHAKDLTYDSSPNAPFYLKVGEAKKLAVKLTPAPDLDEEKTVSWKLEGDEFVSYTVDETNSKKVTIEGKKVGTATLVATNDYNKNLTYKFNIKVIDFDAENEYLWQYDSSDRAQFGYESVDDKKAGTTEGDAKLGDLTWHYTRSKATSLQSSMGGVGFGKNEEPETHIHFETENSRLVKSFKIEAASAKSLAKMTVKVGETTYLDNVSVPADYYDVIGTINSDPNVTADSGKIQIDIVTPEYDYKTAANDPTYVTPGAFYLKSLYFTYESETIASIKVADDSKHKIDYVVGEEFSLDGLSLKKVSERGYEFDVDVAKEIEAENLTYVVEDMSEASHIAKKVTLSLKVDGYEEPFTCTYDIHVRALDWVPIDLAIEGEVSPQELVEGDLVDYSNLRLKVIYEEDTDFSTYKFSKNSGFTITFGEKESPFVAVKKMEAGYTIDVSRKYTSADKSAQVTLDAHLVVAANVLKITEAIFDRIDFEDPDTLDTLGIKSDGGAKSGIIGQDNRLRFDFTNVVKEKGVAKVNKDFSISILDKELCFKSIDFTLVKLSNNDNKFALKSSIYGGGIYSDELTTAVNQKLSYSEFVDHTNKVLFAAGSNAYLGMVSCVIRYSEQSHIGFTLSAGETAPTKMDYNEGEVFDPSGLTITLHENDSEATADITSYMKWYDGSTFDTEPQTTLLPESTYVVGVFGDVTINVNIGTVHALGISVSKVTSKDDITASGKYYITCPDTKLILKGSSKNGDIFSGKGVEQFSDLEFGDSMELNVLLKEDFVTITPLENGNFTINTVNGFFSITNGGSATCSNTAANYREFSFEFNEEGILTAEIFRKDGVDEETGLDKGPKFYLGCNTSSSIIKLYGENYANIVLYKVAD